MDLDVVVAHSKSPRCSGPGSDGLERAAPATPRLQSPDYRKRSRFCANLLTLLNPNFRLQHSAADLGTKNEDS